MTPPRLRLEHVDRLATRIDQVFMHGPLYPSEALAAALERASGHRPARLDLKLELLNPVRSFKGRGAEALLDIHDGGPLVCASAGNFGQAVAYACGRRGVPLTVFAADGANPLKVERMRALGGRVRLGGVDFDDAKARARAHAAEGGGRFVEDGREAAVSEGAGTIALELLARPERADVLLVPLGNGALLAGVALVLKARAPEVRVVAVAAHGAPAMVRSLREGRAVSTERVDTIADGIAVRVPVPEALEDLRARVDDTVLVSEASIRQGMRLVLEHVGVVAEPAAVVGVAALLDDPASFAGRHVATIVTGGNATMDEVLRMVSSAPAGAGGSGGSRPRR